MRKVIITSPGNTSNFKTITNESCENGEWKPVSRLEMGTVYNTYFRFDSEGKISFEKRVNKIKNTHLIATTIRNENGNYISLLDYNGKKNIGFKINTKNIK